MRAVQASIASDFAFNSTAIAQVLAVVPSKRVDKVLTTTQKHNKRERDLPNRLMVFFPILLGIFAHLPYSEVFRRLRDAYDWLGLEVPEKIPSEAAMVKARQRIGFEPLKALFDEVMSDTLFPEAPAAYYKGLLLTSVDGCVIDIENSKENAIFGYSTNQGGDGWYPQLRCVAVVEFYSRTLMDMEYGTGQGSCEQLLAEPVLARLKPGTLNLADRLYYSFKLWQVAQASGAHLVWRVKKDMKLAPVEVFPDGSFLARIHEYDEKRHRTGKSTIVRVIEYKLKDCNETYRLITTLLDHSFAPADELALLYPLRYWTSEGFIKEVKTVLGRPRLILRSKSPVMVIQEFYGLLLAHHAIRLLMLQAAEMHALAPSELSFAGAVFIVRRHLTTGEAFP